jgi:hypothetical protein
MYEHRDDKLISGRRFLRRFSLHLAAVLGLMAFSLALGMAGYMGFEELSWQDAFLNSAMLLGGMGPIHNPETAGGKLFAGLYALYCGLVVIVSMGVLLTPVLHRAMHLFHWRRDHPK